MKPISTKTHGALDYLSAALIAALPRALGWDENVTRRMDAAALGTLAYSILTDYELGPIKAIAMGVHLTFDAVSALLFLSAGALLPDESDEVVKTLQAIGLFEATVVALSQSKPYKGEGRG